MQAKLFSLFAILAVFASAPVAAQKTMQGMDHSKPAVAAESDRHLASGRVVRANPKKGRVTLDHEPVASLNWPSMTMGFLVKDPALFEQLKVGAEIEFEFVQEGKKYVVTKVR